MIIIASYTQKVKNEYQAERKAEVGTRFIIKIPNTCEAIKLNIPVNGVERSGWRVVPLTPLQVGILL